MSKIIVENSLTGDIIACRTCLTTKRKLYSIHEYNFSEGYMHLCGNRINETFQQPGRWHDLVIPAPEPAGSLTHRVTHELKGLEPGAVYEAIVQAKNRYGWNEVSDIFQFHTLGGSHTAHADELTPMFSAASPLLLTRSAAALALYITPLLARLF